MNAIKYAHYDAVFAKKRKVRDALVSLVLLCPRRVAARNFSFDLKYSVFSSQPTDELSQRGTDQVEHVKDIQYVHSKDDDKRECDGRRRQWARYPIE
jgi:hypothetical protein